MSCKLKNLFILPVMVISLACIGTIQTHAFANPPAQAKQETNNIEIQSPYSFATAKGMTNGAVFMTIINNGDKSDWLQSANTDICETVELHSSIVDEKTGKMTMRPIDAINIDPGKSATLKPGGLHIMLMRLKNPLEEGKEFPLELNFKNSGKHTVTVKIVKAGTAMMNMQEEHTNKHE